MIGTVTLPLEIRSFPCPPVVGSVKHQLDCGCVESRATKNETVLTIV